MSKAKISVTGMTSLAEARAFAPKWAELAEAAGASNPFVHPDWMIPWAERSVRSGEQIWLLAAQQNGRLVGVAPFYRRSWGSGLAHSMQPWGTGRNCDLIELPQLLLDQGQARNVARALVGRLCAEAKLWDWAFVPLEDSLWFEPDWLPGVGSIIVLTRTVRASVVRHIDTSSPPVVKRNVRESVHRAHNRLDRAYPGRWFISRATSRSDILDAFPDLLSLHIARSRIVGKEMHSNVLKQESNSSLLLAVLAASADRGGACIYRLLVDGHAMAALLVLRTAECSYFLLSGMSEPSWEYSPVTLLQSCAIDDAIKLDHRRVNLSTGPDTAKMRWSEHVSVNPEFVLVPNRPLPLARFGTYFLASAVAGVRRERSRHGLLSSHVRSSDRTRYALGSRDESDVQSAYPSDK
jgi:CelD/BcsL family acetyltransferase involved in cellulose biosynthesis